MFTVKKAQTKKKGFLGFARESDGTIKTVYYMGQLPEEHGPTVAIVGSRKQTQYGREITRQLAESRARRGVVVVSGLALGHDALAHEGALNGGGVTVAVLGTPLPKITPATNYQLGKRILANGGLILSEIGEIPPGQDSRIFYKRTFLQRNRIVAGLADVVIVIEANRYSGTLNTVRHALAQGKDVMAVPGNVTSPLSEGCNRLIQQGATPLLELKDVLEKLGIADDVKEPTKVKLDDKNEKKIYQLISKGVRSGEDLQAKSGLEPSEFNVALTMLEIKGLIRNTGANNWGMK
jgi:DNA processing protein